MTFSPFLNFSNKGTIFSSDKSSYTYSLLTYIIGAFTHAPKHSTSVNVNKPSFVVSPFLIPKWLSIFYITFSAPLTIQGVVPQNYKWYLPTGVLLNIV